MSTLIQGPFKQRISSILNKRSIRHSQFSISVPVLSEQSELLSQKWFMFARPSGLWELTCKTIRSYSVDLKSTSLEWTFDQVHGFHHFDVDKLWQDYFKIPKYLALSEWLNFAHPSDKERVLGEFRLFLRDKNRQLNCRYRMASIIGIELVVQSTGQHPNQLTTTGSSTGHTSGFHQVLSADLDYIKNHGPYGRVIEDCEKAGIDLCWQSIDWTSLRLSSEVLSQFILTLTKPLKNNIYSIRISQVNEKNNHCISCKEAIDGEYVILQLEIEDHYFHPRHLRQILQYGYASKQIQNSNPLRLDAIVHDISGHLNITSLENRIIYSFYFSNNPSSTNKPKSPFETIHRKPHILVVDDHEVVLRYLEEILTVAGYRVTTISNSRTALSLFESTPDNFDLVITDLSMPDLRGSELVCRILKCRSKMAVVVCSGDNGFLAEEEAKKAGATGFFSKPIDIPSLLRLCRSQFDGKVAFPSKDLA